MKHENNTATSAVPAAAEEPTPDANRFTADAQARMERLRAMSAEFEDPNEQRPLTRSEMALARRTPIAALEKAAVFLEASPIGSTIGDPRELRDAIAYELAYGGVRDESRALYRRSDMAILRRKLKAAKVARAVYTIGKGVTTLDSGDPLKTHLADMKRALVRTRRKKTVTPEEAAAKKS